MHKLLQPDPSAIEPREHSPTHDRAPDDLAEGTPKWLRDDLAALVGEAQVLSRVSDLVRFATDASPYFYSGRSFTLLCRARQVLAWDRWATSLRRMW